MNRLFALALITIPIVIGVAAAPYSATIESVWAAPEDSWTSKTPMNQARGRLGVVAVNGKIYAIGGDSGIIVGLIGQDRAAGTGLVVNVTEEYDPTTDTWIFKEPMPTARDYFGIVVYNNKIYCIGGMAHNETVGVNEVYDPATDKWETKTPMLAPRYKLSAHAVDGRIYLIDSSYSNGTTQVYDPQTDSWEFKTPPPHRTLGSASAVFDDKIYFLNISGFVQIYDVKSDSWRTGSKSPIDLVTITAGATSGVNAPVRIYFFDETGTYIYDPESDSWSTGAHMPTSRGFTGVAAINDTFYVVGGVTFPYSGAGRMRPNAANERYFPIGYDLSGLPSYPQVSPSSTLNPLSPETEPVYSYLFSLLAIILAGTVVVCAILLFYFKKPKTEAT